MFTTSKSNDMLKFFIKSFSPSYVIHVNPKNRILSLDTKLINDFHIKEKDVDKFVGLNIIDVLSNTKNFSNEFIKTVSTIIKDNDAGLCAINNEFKISHSLAIPSIYILLIIVENKTISNNQIKEIKIFNYIEIARFLSKLFSKNILCPLECLTELYKDSVREKSIFFAFESLKAFGTFISENAAVKINQQKLADIVFPFHNNKKTPELTQRFVNEFLRSTGYIEYDKLRKTKELSLAVLEQLTTKHLIPFNSIDTNYIVHLK